MIEVYTWVKTIHGAMQIKILNLYIINTRTYIHT